MKRLLLLFAALLLTLTTWAVPARRYTFTVQQPDGSVITLQLVGDEYFHYYRNVETGEALTLASDGSYVPLSSAEKQTRQKVGQQRRVAANAQRAKRMAKRRADGPNRVGTIKPMSGTKKGLVILVNFSDVKMKSTSTKTAFDNMFNQEGYNLNGHVGSVRDYFKDQSYGALDIQFDVVGPVTVSHNMAYYGQNNSSGSDLRAGDMVREAVDLCENLVNFKDYDWDGDDEVDQVYVIYAGYGESMGAPDETIWPHEWDLNSATDDFPILDDVIVNTYACSSELSGTSGSTLAPIGTACHEFSHCLGFPDLYDPDYSGAFGMNVWDVMDSGSYNGPSGYGEVPSGYTAYERWQAGWLTPTELTSAKTVSGMKDLGTDAESYILYNPSNRDEYLLFENRQPQKWFSYIANNRGSGGLLVTHVDYDDDAWKNNTVNDNVSRQRCTIIPAGKQYGTKTGSSGEYQWSATAAQYKSMLFPAGATSLTETSHASYGGKWFNGTNKSLGHAITEITNTDGLVGFKFDGGGVEDDGSRYTVTFDPGTGSCSTKSWTQTTFGESIQVPDAYVASSATGYTFIGWSETPATGSKPATIYGVKNYYTPTTNITLYAVYKSTTAGSGSTTDYQTYPGTAELKTPSLSFLSKTQTLSVGEYKVVAATVTSNPGNAQVTYSSSDETVATVGPKTGGVKAQGAGTCTIIATIPAVDGVSREARASYTLTVTEPATTSIYIATPPTKTTYNVGDAFDPTGMVVKRRFDNGNAVTIASSYYSWEPSGALSASDTKVTVKYNEDGNLFTADVPITVKAPVRYTVTFDACGGSCLTASLTELISGAGVTLPAATTSVTGWKFAGWSTERISENMSTSPKVYAAGSNYKPTANATLYAVYVYTETAGGGSGNYECVTEALSDWSGDYVIGGYTGSKMYFADGRIGGSKADTGSMGEANKLANVVYNENEDYVTGESGDLYHVTLVACTGGYLLRTQDGLYNFRSVDGNNAINNGIMTSDDAAEAAKYPVVITLEEDGYVTMKSATAEFCLNIAQGSTYFRFYKRSTAANITNSIYLYRKQGSVLSSTYCSYPAGDAPLTVSALTKVISGLPSGTTTLSELQTIVDRILQR